MRKAISGELISVKSEIYGFWDVLIRITFSDDIIDYEYTTTQSKWIENLKSDDEFILCVVKERLIDIGLKSYKANKSFMFTYKY